MILYPLILLLLDFVFASRNNLRFCAVVSAPVICSVLQPGNLFQDSITASHLTSLVATHLVAPPDLPDCDFHGLVIFAEYLGKTSLETIAGIFLETESTSWKKTLFILALRAAFHSDLVFPGPYIFRAARRPWVMRRPRFCLPLI